MIERYSLSVETATGTYSVAFGPNHHIGAVLGEVLARMGRGNDGTYQLVYAQEPLDPTNTLGASPVENGATLFLDSNPAGGI